eukprot:scaffold13019_cov26-Prasinocladus_malaysianus.AAC.1
MQRKQETARHSSQVRSGAPMYEYSPAGRGDGSAVPQYGTGTLPVYGTCTTVRVRVRGTVSIPRRAVAWVAWVSLRGSAVDKQHIHVMSTGASTRSPDLRASVLVRSKTTDYDTIYGPPRLCVYDYGQRSDVPVPVYS